jgi:predicted MFS family arabinose efflux permease
MKKIFNQYIKTFSGLSKEVWVLSLITLINRAGAMVIPFLSLYLTEDLNFSLKQVGWVMTAFGLGSLFGTWIGGKLSDAIGYYKVILASLIGTGIAFIFAQYISSFWAMCAMFFVLIAIADSARPAFFVALSAYSKPENKTRSLTLLRLAINLGFSAGPALGGLIIAYIGFNGIFWVDGITCILAAFLLFKMLHPKKVTISDQEVIVENPLPPHRDFPYVIFLVALAIFGFIFVQYFSTMPLYYSKVFSLSKQNIGLILAMNGALIFVFEMPLIAFLESKSKKAINYVIIGLLLTALSFVAVLITPWAGIVVVGMIIATVGEMIAFPFGNAFALSRSKVGKQGAYMGLYGMSFSLAHIFGHNTGMQLIDLYGYNTTWIIMALAGIIAWFLLLYVKKALKKESIHENLPLK